jgi:UDP-glucose 4-epimerase
VIEGSVRDAMLVERLVGGSDFVFHLASVVGVTAVLRRPTDTVLTNTLGSANVLGSAAKHGVPCLLASSSEVYGKAGEDGEPLTEDGDLLIGSPHRSRWCYAASKLSEEFLAAGYHQESKLPVTVVRPFNIIGRRQSHLYGMVVPRFVNWALHGEPLQVYGDGRQTRSFAYVLDVVEVLIRLADSTESRFRVLNVGSDARTSILTLAKLVIEMTQSPSEIRFVRDPSVIGRGFEDMSDRTPSLDRLRATLGNIPQTTLRAGIRDVITDYRTSSRTTSETSLEFQI